MHAPQRLHRLVPPHGPPRAVRIWLPPAYEHQPGRRFPVLYLMDGQNVFDGPTAVGGPGWRAGATVQRLIAAQRLQPLLLVAVDHGGPWRTDEYTPVPWHGRGGGAGAFGSLVADVVVPFVDANYRTQREPAARAIAGSSLGGLFALQLALWRPDLFGGAAALSPTVWWGEGALLRSLAALPGRLPVRIWLDAGQREGRHLRQHVRATAELLASKGWVRHRQAAQATLRHVEVPRAGHSEADWGRRLDRVLKFLFPPAPRVRRRTALV